MKSAYELAMERLNQGKPDLHKLTDAQKKQLAEVDSIYKARIAEAELKHSESKRDLANSPAGTSEELDREFRSRVQSLKEEMEREKDKIRSQKSKA